MPTADLIRFRNNIWILFCHRDLGRFGKSEGTCVTLKCSVFNLTCQRLHICPSAISGTASSVLVTLESFLCLSVSTTHRLREVYLGPSANVILQQ